MADTMERRRSGAEDPPEDDSAETSMVLAAPPSEASPPSRPEAPDGGWGWVVIAATFTMGILTGGTIVGMSILYIELTEYFHSTKGYTGWIASLFSFSGYSLGPVYGALLRLYGNRKMTIIGGAIFSSGFLMSYFAPNVAFLYVSCGIVAGVGRGIVLMCNVVVVQQYFTKKRALAAGIAGSGTSLGALVCGPLIQLLIDTYGLRGAFLILSGACLHIIPLGGLIRPLANARRPKHTDRNANQPAEKAEGGDVMELDADNTTSHSQEIPRKTSIKASCMSQIRELIRDALDFSLMKDPKYLLYLISTFLFAMGIGIYLQHTPSRAISLGLSRKLSALLQVIFGVGTFAGRFVFSGIGNIRGVNRILMYGLLLFLCGVLYVFYELCKDFLSISIHVALAGLFTGGTLSIIPTTLTDLMGVENITKSYSLIGVVSGCAMLLGIPLAGFIYDVTDDYDIPFYIGGALQIVGALLIVVLALLGRCKTWLSRS